MLLHAAWLADMRQKCRGGPLNVGTHAYDQLRGLAAAHVPRGITGRIPHTKAATRVD